MSTVLIAIIVVYLPGFRNCKKQRGERVQDDFGLLIVRCGCKSLVQSADTIECSHKIW